MPPATEPDRRKGIVPNAVEQVPCLVRRRYFAPSVMGRLFTKKPAPFAGGKVNLNVLTAKAKDLPAIRLFTAEMSLFLECFR